MNANVGTPPPTDEEGVLTESPQRLAEWLQIHPLKSK